MTALEITGLDKSFGTLSVLRNLDLTVEAGSFTSVLGPSGSGKTTLLRVIAGFERVDRGEVRLDGVVVDDGTQYVAPDRRRIGYVPQDGSLFPHLTVAENIAFGLARRDRRGRRVAELVDIVELGGMERRYPHQLSGGQQQRVAVARALAIDPALVLLDEPFSSLDAHLRAAVRHDVRRVLHEAGTTAILVTHDQDEALSLADRVAIMTDGRIGQYDTPADLYAAPASPELARGLGEANFLHGVARGDVVETPLGPLAVESAPISGDVLAPGSRLLVLVRPEQIELSDDRAGAAGTARVVDTEFYGHDAVVRLLADWDDATSIVVRLANATALPRKDAHVGLTVRGRVVVWSDRGVRIAPASPAVEQSDALERS